MSLNMYLGEVQSQTQSMNAICNATIQSMEQAIQSIDAFAIDTVLQGQTYSSAKAYLVQTFRPLAQGIICLCEELIRQNEAFPNEFQAKVASTDVIEQEIREQIRGINQSITSIEAIEVLTPMPGVGAIVTVLGAMRKKLEEKLEHLYEFNHSSSNNYSTALQLAASITAGLAEVQSGKGFSPVSGTFHSEKLNMEWAKQIQIIIEEKIRKSDNGIGKSVDLEHNVYNDIEGISSENQSINNRFTKEEIQATQKYLEGIKNGTIKGNIGEDFQVETDDYEMEHNIFGQPVGGRRPVLNPFLIGVAKFGFDFLFGDLFTLFDPEATYGEKLLAVGMMTPYGKGVKIVDKLHDLKKVGDVKKATSGSVGVAKGTGKTTEPYDVVPYRPSNSPLENHHGVMDVWAKHNVPDYVSRGANTPTIALTKEQHNATKAVYRQWLFEKTGKKVGGKVDWKSVSPKEIQELTEKMFDAANVPRLARQEYYRAFNQYNFRE
ncbi:T7SS effector LXG polymorphic toxin [Bacillus pacificus]|uniref:T7SS effector LXG polymorphic toxin n=1 Tax=Bacillus pacificus TaxID=2026187 RepID=UPI003D1A1DC9